MQKFRVHSRCAYVIPNFRHIFLDAIPNISIFDISVVPDLFLLYEARRRNFMNEISTSSDAPGNDGTTMKMIRPTLPHSLVAITRITLQSRRKVLEAMKSCYY